MSTDQNSARSGSSPMESMADSQVHQRGAKRLRLSVACNRCRARKVRCDASLPKCRNCITRNEVCETTDLRNPGGPAPAVRQLAPSKTDRSSGPGAEDSADQERVPYRNLTTPAPDSVAHTPAVGSTSQPAAAPRVSKARKSPGTKARANGERTTASRSCKRKASQSAEQPAPKADFMSWLRRAYNAYVADNLPEGSNGNTTPTPPPAVTGPAPDVVVNTDGTPDKVKYMGGSSLQCLCRFVDLHLTRRGLSPASTQFKHGMERSEEFELPIDSPLPNLPPPQECQKYVDAFFDRLWPIFPVVDRSYVQDYVDSCQELKARFRGDQLGDHATCKRGPKLAMGYAIIAIGADEINGRTSETGTKYLTAAYWLYAHLIANPHLLSVQAMFLIALALRGQNRDGQAWHVLGHAIRTAHSIGLHKHITDLSTTQEGDDTDINSVESLRRRVWWSCFALEKLMQLESGRPSVINSDLDDTDLRQISSWSRSSANAESTNDAPSGNQGHFTAWVALSQILGRISHHIYNRKSVNSWNLLSETARLDQALVDWERSLPDSLRLSNITSSESFVGHNDPMRQHLSGFLWQQFCHAQIALFRAALVFPSTSFEQEVTKHGDNLPSAARLLNSANLCADAARKTITTVLYLADHGIRSILLGPNPPYLGAVVLALCILRQPTRRLARADLELLRSATLYVEDVYRSWDYSEDFIRGCALLREHVQTVLDQLPESPAAGNRPPSTTTRQGLPAEEPAVARSAWVLQSEVDGTVTMGGSLHGSSVEQAQLDGGEAAATNAYECGFLPNNDVQDHHRQDPALLDPLLQTFEGIQFEDIWAMVGSEFLIENDNVVFAPL
ncbi:hypothetical protein MCOR29_005276 [Pyricularia oryzae]|uniref:Zn(2)-C6 fungal-type domain-containing protein n=1 Tax=Pyricularia grisea TaxID=148305 RepID=A0ABQ8NJN1_PYRGI|nr:hypothetical protein MCOR33_005791 [Pyricularia grisea]KAI6320542.1 hypothetical protein MCOR29_005276 [Pyricularia oryzae]KAI6471140.1 hypothetical protein MCOR15_001028 [Pyricularia oryzae]KAI6493225.1 hypothetical protein MCOR11_006307 [Pyricularia oryzae]KAI6529862.1 hypothetical protein MCOR16_004829 [Pyricularia oryzae]